MRADAARARGERTTALAPAAVTAIVPFHEAPPSESLVAAIGRHVGRVLLVGDGVSDACARRVESLADRAGYDVLRLRARSGKGTAVALGIRHALGSAPPPTAVLVVDADGQHPPDAIPAFLAAAAESELVVGDRFANLRSIPWDRRVMNLLSTALLAAVTRRRVRDSQCGMRLLRGRALTDVRFPAGGYEAETTHLKRCLAAGLRVVWVPLPAIYDGAPSSYRAVRDTARIAAALLAQPRGSA